MNACLSESEIQPRSLIAVEGNSALLLRPIKQPRDKSTEQAMKAAISAKLKPWRCSWREPGWKRTWLKCLYNYHLSVTCGISGDSSKRKRGGGMVIGILPIAPGKAALMALAWSSWERSGNPSTCIWETKSPLLDFIPPRRLPPLALFFPLQVLYPRHVPLRSTSL